MTAVEYLFTHLFPYLDFSKVEDRIKIRQIEQDAFNLQEEQIKSAFNVGMVNSDDYFVPWNKSTEAENYYNKTFKQH